LTRAADDTLTQQLRRAGEMFAAARRLVPDPAQSPAVRSAAASLLNRDQADRDRDISTLAALLTPQTPEAIQRVAVKALGRGGDARVPVLLLKDWPADPPELRTTIVDEMLAREPWALDLLGRIERGQLGATDIDAQHRDRLLKHRSENVRTLAARVLAAAANSDRQKVIDSFRPALALAGDAPRGKLIFARLCTPCHRLDNVGHEIGPNLVSVKGHPSEKLLTSILDPSREVEPRYLAYNCTLSNGEELYGLIVSESGNSITLKLADDSTHAILRSEITSLRSTRNSLMPEGLETGLMPQDLADLIQYLRIAGSGD
jgi:putative heme-binding domain-containing protein